MPSSKFYAIYCSRSDGIKEENSPTADQLSKELKADIPVLDIMGTSSVTDLCRKIASISKAVDTKEERAEGTQAAT